jgi:F-type H+-transporting ATPase subunit delta
MTYGPERRYGKALFELAKEEKNLPSIVEEVSALIETLQDKKNGLADLLHNPMISHKKKAGVLAELAKKAKLSDTIRKFISLMALKGRGDVVVAALTYFQEFYMASEGMVKVKVTSAFPIASKQKSDIEAFVKKKAKGSKTIELEEKIDEKLIGGFKVLVGSQEFDASLSGSLGKIKTVLRS